MGHLCGTRQAAQKMALSISDTMKQKMIQQLKTERGPISLILGNHLKLRLNFTWEIIKFVCWYLYGLFTLIWEGVNFVFWYPYNLFSFLQAILKPYAFYIRASLLLSH